MNIKTRTKSAILFIVLAAGLSAFAQKAENPATVWCDYHSAQFVKGGVEFPSGVCHDVYTHTYYQNRRMLTHKMTVRCP
ncbi:MAG TPA: hypothetical protein VIL74_08755 [Pyrinomonadaceae bacterium]|jgi:hypothetical protein